MNMKKLSKSKVKEFTEYLFETANDIKKNDVDLGPEYTLSINQRLRSLWETAVEDYELEGDEEDAYGEVFDSLEEKLEEILA